MSGKQNIINGFRKHFSNLAVPIFDPDFNYKSSDINDYEITSVFCNMQIGTFIFEYRR
jgi:hypothetical protein